MWGLTRSEDTRWCVSPHLFHQPSPSCDSRRGTTRKSLWTVAASVCVRLGKFASRHAELNYSGVLWLWRNHPSCVMDCRGGTRRSEVLRARFDWIAGGGIELGRPWPLPRRRDRCGDRTKFPVSRAPVARALRSVLAPRLAQDADRSTVRCRRAARSMRLRVDPSPAGRFELGSVELERWRRRSPKRLRGPARCPAD